MDPVLETEIRQLIRDERLKAQAEERKSLKDLRDQPARGVVPGGDGATE